MLWLLSKFCAYFTASKQLLNVFSTTISMNVFFCVTSVITCVFYSHFLTCLSGLGCKVERGMRLNVFKGDQVMRNGGGGGGVVVNLAVEIG